MRKLIGAAALLAVLLAAVLSGVGALRYDIAAALSAVLCCVPFFVGFEKRAPSAGELVLIAVMTAFAAAGRFIFAPLPFFKPVTAVVVAAGMSFGGGAGFMVGALSAVVSNIYFGQGAWTPFQMLCWGLIGFFAGLLNQNRLLEKTVPLVLYGAAAGVFYSLVMDVWTVLSADFGFNLSRWLAAVVSALPITAVYCVSNVVFLLAIRKPFFTLLQRLKTKYGVFSDAA